jgi:Putative peptidoglycan binding domain
MSRAIAAFVLVAATVGTSLATAPIVSAAPSCDHSKSVQSVFSSLVIVPSVQSTGSTDCTLGVGNQGRGVTRLQSTLNACYHERLGITERLMADGIFGSATRAELIKVQRFERTAPDGVYGRNTRDAMLHEKRDDVGCEPLVL